MARPVRLAASEVAAALSAPGAPAWDLVDGRLVTTVACPSFVEALAFVAEVGRLAEDLDHHPDIDIRYRDVTLVLVTHDAGGLTVLDLDLARAIDAVRPASSG
jgi:4a-hydroxytetrahydrobiopterin dehydratase